MGFGIDRWLDTKPGIGVELDLGHELVDGLEGFWTFNEGVGDSIHDLRNNNHGTNSGAVWGSGNFGDALDFDGTDIVKVPDDSTLVGFSEFTLEAWFLIRSMTGGGSGARLISKSNGSTGDDYGVVLRGSNRNPGARAIIGGVTKLAEPSPAEPVDFDRWYQIVGVWDGIGIGLFIDAVQRANISTSGAIADNAKELGFGGHPDSGGRYIDGFISHIRIWSRALSLDNIEWLRYEPFSMIKPRFRRTWFDVAAVAGANPKGPLGHPLYGAFGGPL